MKHPLFVAIYPIEKEKWQCILARVLPGLCVVGLSARKKKKGVSNMKHPLFVAIYPFEKEKRQCALA